MVTSDVAMRWRFSQCKRECVESNFDREAFEKTLSDATLVGNHSHVHPYGEDGPHDHEDQMASIPRPCARRPRRSTGS